MSNKGIQQNFITSANNNSTCPTNSDPKFQNNKLRQKNKIILSNFYEYHQKTTPPTSTKYSTNRYQQNIIQIQ